MIIKEYRIPMPLDIDEYRIAQLYMIAKKSKLESEGNQSGVEILVNEPYSDGPGGQGQFTNKVYYIAAHLPYWLRSFLPQSISTIKEEAWNAYPYSKNVIFTPYLTKFSVEIESKYLRGGPNQHNVFQLNDDELKQRTEDHVDFVKEKLTGRDYLAEEDPNLYKSEKSGRGPLADDWLSMIDQSQNSDDSKKLMCVYKICRVRFDQWPIQGRIEKFIHDYIRNTLIRAHRQAWAWQDEWIGLNIDDIREMEKETQECLASKIKDTQ